MVGGGCGNQLKCNENFHVAKREVEKGFQSHTAQMSSVDANLCPLERSRDGSRPDVRQEVRKQQ